MFDSTHNYHSPQFVFIFLAYFVLSFIFPRLRPSLRASRLSLPCAPSPVSLHHCCLILSLPSFPLLSFLGSRTSYMTGPGSDHPSGSFGKHRNSEEGSGELHTVWSPPATHSAHQMISWSLPDASPRSWQNLTIMVKKARAISMGESRSLLQSEHHRILFTQFMV